MKRMYIAKCDADPDIRVPNMGKWRPKRWRLEQEFFVDHSGFGRDNDPALTQAEFIACVKAGRGYGVIDIGQFQLYVGEFIKV